ncbi:MAG: hypothetical protein EZS28_010393 [Streblomastix strix]|uniref:Uncharacterized protein n=1 Tax=Streblomastix strix TaxID=222440 RepID=A0A5J4WIC0_9EUKA|nr:MAG: hypothetical protein EZS28_010393 [Streblomastix strix]
MTSFKIRARLQCLGVEEEEGTQIFEKLKVDLIFYPANVNQKEGKLNDVNTIIGSEQIKFDQALKCIFRRSSEMIHMSNQLEQFFLVSPLVVIKNVKEFNKTGTVRAVTVCDLRPIKVYYKYTRHDHLRATGDVRRDWEVSSVRTAADVKGYRSTTNSEEVCQ